MLSSSPVKQELKERAKEVAETQFGKGQTFEKDETLLRSSEQNIRIRARHLLRAEYTALICVCY